MTSTTTAPVIPYGTWPSPISAAIVAAGASPLTQLVLGGADGGDVYWLAGQRQRSGPQHPAAPARRARRRCHARAVQCAHPRA